MNWHCSREKIINLQSQWAITHEWFDGQWWHDQQAVTGEAGGRGTTLFVRYQHHHLILRHYRRGGLIGKFIRDSFLFLGWQRTRAAQELALLNYLRKKGLLVPEPVAARLQRHGLVYRNDLLQMRIPAARDLVAILASQPLGTEQWQAVGRAIAQLHQTHCYHHDLNLRNLMQDDQQQIWIIDFDRCRLRKPGTWQQQNLQRLLRSLRKESRLGSITHWQEQRDWPALLRGYEQA